MNNKDLIEHSTKVMVAKLENISIPECLDCKKGINGIPDCHFGECDLPIQLMNKNGKIGIIVSNLKIDKWDFQVKDKTYDIYYLFGFDESWDNILHVWKIPKAEILNHLEFSRR